MSEIKLLPCPFCGGRAFMYATGNASCGILVEIICDECGCRTRRTTERKAIIKWNTRKPMQEIMEKLKEKSFVDYDEYYTDCGEMLVSFSDIIEIVKEVGGMND